MTEKDFLSQFTEKGKVPESFKEEERKPVQKPAKQPVNKKLVVIVLILLAAIAVGVYFILFAPKIEMPDFEGKTKNDVAAWVKQQDIESSGIVFEDAYYFDYDEDTIISQSVEAGKKVKEDVKITFVSSLGPDPDELITVPDLENMTKSEIQDWISEYKLTKTKVTSAYSDTVEEGNVISYAYSGCEEDTFTRSSTLKISVSKGEAPAGTIAVEDFSKKTYDYASSWATTKKVTLTKTEQFSDTVDKGYIISQSIASGKTMKEDETLNVVVSKGKAVKIDDFSGMSSSDITRWCTKNSVVLYTISEYSDVTKDEFVRCTPTVGTTIASGDSIDVVISLGEPNITTTLTTELELLDWIDAANAKGADLEAVNDGPSFSDTAAAGTLAYYETENECGDHVHYSISRGKNLWLANVSWADTTALNGKTESDIRTWLTNDKITNYIFRYEKSTTVDINKTISIVRSDGVALANNTYLPEDVTIVITICSEKVSS